MSISYFYCFWNKDCKIDILFWGSVGKWLRNYIHIEFLYLQKIPVLLWKYTSLVLIICFLRRFNFFPVAWGELSLSSKNECCDNFPQPWAKRSQFSENWLTVLQRKEICSYLKSNSKWTKITQVEARWYNASHFLSALRICSNNTLSSFLSEQQRYWLQFLSAWDVEWKDQRVVIISLHSGKKILDFQTPAFAAVFDYYCFALYSQSNQNIKSKPLLRQTVSRVLTGLDPQEHCGCISCGGSLCIPLVPGASGHLHCWLHSLPSSSQKYSWQTQSQLSQVTCAPLTLVLTGALLPVFRLFTRDTSDTSRMSKVEPPIFPSSIMAKNTGKSSPNHFLELWQLNN